MAFTPNSKTGNFYGKKLKDKSGVTRTKEKERSSVDEDILARLVAEVVHGCLVI